MYAQVATALDFALDNDKQFISCSCPSLLFGCIAVGLIVCATVNNANSANECYQLQK